MLCLCSVSGSGGGAVSHLGPGKNAMCPARLSGQDGTAGGLCLCQLLWFAALGGCLGAWQPLTGVNAARNFAAIIIPACGYGVSFLGAEEHVRAEEMRKKASMDPLTGLKNRRAMLNDIQEMMETLSEPLWLVCLDLDNFKSINDQYGHDIGDQYLRRFGRCWKK